MSWPIATYLPFLWNPADHMFVQPDVTRDPADWVVQSFIRVVGAYTDADLP